MAKYCNEHVCLCVCVCVCVYLSGSMHISRSTRRDLYQIFMPVAMARSSSGGVTKSQEKGQFWRVVFPDDNALYSIAFGTHTKTAEPIEMSFGMMTRVGHR